MAFVEERIFKYPAEDECLVRRLGSAVIAIWPALPEDIRHKLMAEARTAWDREYHVPRLHDRLESIMRRHPGRN
jgi:hypothetical protein